MFNFYFCVSMVIAAVRVKHLGIPGTGQYSCLQCHLYSQAHCCFLSGLLAAFWVLQINSGLSRSPAVTTRVCFTRIPHNTHCCRISKEYRVTGSPYEVEISCKTLFNHRLGKQHIPGTVPGPQARMGCCFPGVVFPYPCRELLPSAILFTHMSQALKCKGVQKQLWMGYSPAGEEERGWVLSSYTKT